MTASMKAVLDHIGIAVRDLDAALAFYRDALGLEVRRRKRCASQRVRAHFLRSGESASSCSRRPRPIRRLRSISRSAALVSTTSRCAWTTSARRWRS